MDRKTRKLQRDASIRNAERAIAADARACLLEVVATLQGETYEALRGRVADGLCSRKLARNGREFTVLFDVAPDTGPRGEHLLLNFQVDDGGRYLMPPDSRFFVVHPSETFRLPGDETKS